MAGEMQPGSFHQEEETTDENLTHRLLRGYLTAAKDDGAGGRLSPDYAVAIDPASFFVVGRVFKVLWVQPLGQNAGPEPANAFKAHFGELFHAKIQRFVVVKPKQKQRQISTNGGKGAAKTGLKQGEHTIAYTTAVAPDLLSEEIHITKDPIQIIPVSQTEKLDPKSRINLGKVYPVEHNVKVCEVGMVADADIRKLTAYYKTGLRKDLSG